MRFFLMNSCRKNYIKLLSNYKQKVDNMMKLNNTTLFSVTHQTSQCKVKTDVGRNLI